MDRRPLLLWISLALLALLGAGTVREVGVVGEVALGSRLDAPPEVLVDFEPRRGAEGASLGPLHASLVRPYERLGPLPLAINSYTGGLADWPAKLVFWVTRSDAAAQATTLALGALFVALLHRFLRFHGSAGSGGLAALLLVTDWSWLFYRKVLGGTEVLLQAAALLVLWAFWSRRWAGGRLGAPAIAVGIGLGLQAKITFVPTLAAFALAALITRRDRPSLREPDPPRPWAQIAVVLALVSPLIISFVHHLGLPELPSHDNLGLQVERLLAGLRGEVPDRESGATLLWFFGNPLQWFEAAYGAPPQPRVSALRVAHWGLVLGGTALEWLRRGEGRSAALLRFLSIFAPAQVLLLWLANHDLHHLAQASPTLAAWSALALVRLVSERVNPRNPLRAVWGVGLALPMLIAGVGALRATDPLLAQIRVPAFTRQGQAALAALVDPCPTTWTTDYDLYGTLDVLRPDRRFVHAWGAVATWEGSRAKLPEAVLGNARGSCYLVVRQSAPMVYNLSPSPNAVLKGAEATGAKTTLIGELNDAEGSWARLYRVE